MEQLHSGFLSERSWGGGGWRGCWFGAEVTPHHRGAPGWAPMGAPRLPDVAQRGLTECTVLPLNPGKGTQKKLFARGRGTIASPFPTQRELGGSPARGSPCSHFTPTPAARGAQPGSGASSSQLETRGRDQEDACSKMWARLRRGPKPRRATQRRSLGLGASLRPVSQHPAPAAQPPELQLFLESRQSPSRAGFGPFCVCSDSVLRGVSPCASSGFFLSPFGLSARVCT